MKLEIILILFSLVLVFCFLTVSAQEPTWNYEGNWYSTGFPYYESWKGFTDFFIESMLEVNVIEKDGEVQLSTTDPFGNERTSEDFITFNENSGLLVVAFNVTLPTGEFKQIYYEGSVNGEKNLNKFVKPEDYINKTLKDLLEKYIISQNMNFSLVGELSNITIYADKDSSPGSPKFKILYVKNKNESIVDSIDNKTIRNVTRRVSSLNNSRSATNQSSEIEFPQTEYLEDNSVEENESLEETTEQEFEIINPYPEDNQVSMYVNEIKTFSIDNGDYDTIRWYMNKKSLKEKSNSLEIRNLEEGSYSLKVEIKKGEIAKTKEWELIVKKKPKSKLIWYLLILILLIIAISVFLILRYRKAHKEENNSNMQVVMAPR